MIENFQEMSLIELKVLAYDLSVEFHLTKNELENHPLQRKAQELNEKLRALNMEIVARKKEDVEQG